MNNRALAGDERPDGSWSRPNADFFRRTISDLETSWRAEAARAPFYPLVAWTQEGPRLGAATLLKRDGHGQDERLLALLSVAHARDVPPGALKYLTCAEREFHRGDLAKSAMHVAPTGLPALAGSAAARRLHLAAGILDHGFFTPLGLMKACGFDYGPLEALVKYREDQPRAPKGSPDGDSGRGTEREVRREPPYRKSYPNRQSLSLQRPNPVRPHQRLSEAREAQSKFSGGQTSRLRLATLHSLAAIDRTQGRGIPPSAVTDTILTGQTSPGKDPGTTAHYSPTNDLTVITDDATGNVITLRKGRPKGGF